MNKRTIALWACITVLTACEKTPESKAKELIKESLKTSLQGQHYEPGAFSKLDSSFSNNNAPEFEENTKRMAYYEGRMEACNAQLHAFLQNKISRQQVDSIDNLLQRLKDSTKICMARSNELMQDLTPVFAGYQMQHVYNSSNTKHHSVYFFDSLITTIVSQKEVVK